MRDGDKCAICGGSEREKKLVIDHSDGNKDNDDPENLRLLCYSDSMRERWRLAKSKLEWTRERERLSGSPTEQVHKIVDYGQGSPEMQVTDLAEDEYRYYVIARIRLQGPIPKREAINAGAERVGINPTTSRRYLDKLTSSEGPLKEYKDPNWRRKMIALKDTVGESPQSVVEK